MKTGHIFLTNDPFCVILSISDKEKQEGTPLWKKRKENAYVTETRISS